MIAHTITNNPDSCESVCSVEVLCARACDEEQRGTETPPLSNDGNESTHSNISDITDPFQPLPPPEGAPEEAKPFTARALVIGILCGAVINAAQLYLGLKTGIGTSSDLFTAIISFGVIKGLNKAVPQIPALGGAFGPVEHVLILGAAKGSASTAILYSNMVTAMCRLKVFSEPRIDFGKLVLLGLVCSFFGLFAAVPFRKFFIIGAARELQLRFPITEAASMLIRSMHSSLHGVGLAMRRVKLMLLVFAGSMSHKIASSYAPGILYDWHVFTWIYIWGKKQNSAIAVESWGWFFELTPAFVGVGILVGFKIGLSMLIGSISAWGIIGPLLIHYGACKGTPAAPKAGAEWKDYTSYGNMADPAQGELPSPRYWLVWPGTMILVCTTMTELLLYIPTVFSGLRRAARDVRAGWLKFAAKATKRHDTTEKKAVDLTTDKLVEDPASPAQQVPLWLWLPGLILMTAVACITSHFQYNMNPGYAILALVFAFPLGVMMVYCAATTAIVPENIAIKVNQVIFGGISQAQHLSLQAAQTVSLVTSCYVVGIADVCVNLTADFRLGFLLGAPPNLQFYAQALGTVVSIFTAPAIYLVFTTAYPCILNPSEDKICPFSAPQAQVTVAVTKALTASRFPVPLSSGIFACAMGVVAALQVLGRKFLLTGRRERFHKWLPSWVGIGIAFIIPQTQYSIAIFLGSVLGYVWHWKRRDNFDKYSFTTAAGLVAGESFGAVINAILQIAGISGDAHGTTIGCPASQC